MPIAMRRATWPPTRARPVAPASGRLTGRPTWQLVEWVLEFCPPDDAGADWHGHHAGHLAGNLFT
ncbi:hypothetical protein [Actinoplanes sp. NPDC051851]|uniref:hypothetical protein n=1 Tax=Actinoplanes sp. NPDC051851 TaxID=3154753 RepID=UPI00343AB333